jgi:DNA-binding MarR family transcriptional regulator
MAQQIEAHEVASSLRVSIGVFLRSLRQLRPTSDEDLTLPETSALAWLDRRGTSTPSAMARLEEISPQSMGATLQNLQSRGLVMRRNDPADGRRTIISITEKGVYALRVSRDADSFAMARALEREFSVSELRVLMRASPLIERLARSM